MKTCEEIQELVSAYIDDEVTDNDTTAMFFHLGQCPECRTFMTSVLHLDAVLKDNAVHAISRINATHPPVWKRRIALPYPVAAVVAGLMLLSGSLLFIQHTQPPEVIHQTQTAYVYITSLSPVDVVASPLPEKKTN